MAFGNVESNNLISGTLLYITMAINLILIVLCAYLDNRLNKHQQPFTLTNKKLIVWVFLAIIYLISIIGIDDFKESSIAKNQAPLSALVQALFNYKESDFFIGKYIGNQEAYKKYFTKTEIFDTPIPFKKKINIPSPNVIVFFMEGVSAQLLNSYGCQYPNLTPNLDKLAASSLSITNYYNHTAATNRGIRGSLTSGYQLLDGFYEKVYQHESMQRPSLTSILARHNYETTFFLPHPKAITTMYPMLKSLGVENVFYSEKISKEYFNGQLTADSTSSVKDRDLLYSLTKNLQQKEISTNQHPFFIGIYNIGTHAFQNNLKHPYGNGKNEVLNRIHNFDYQFGKFLTYFLNSKLSNNTILIVTADHATFPDPSYRKISKAEFFIDKIPFIIHAPFIDLPKTYDAKGRNSLDFAPTLLHMLNIKHEENMFLGCSLFENCKTQDFSVSAMGYGFFITDAQKLYEEKDIPAAHKKEFIKFKKKIYEYYCLDYEL